MPHKPVIYSADGLRVDEALSALESFFALPEKEKLAVSWLKTPGARGYESFADVAQNEGAGNDASKCRNRSSSHSTNRP